MPPKAYCKLEWMTNFEQDSKYLGPLISYELRFQMTELHFLDMVSFNTTLNDKFLYYDHDNAMGNGSSNHLHFTERDN